MDGLSLFVFSTIELVLNGSCTRYESIYPCHALFVRKSNLDNFFTIIWWPACIVVASFSDVVPRQFLHSNRRCVVKI